MIKVGPVASVNLPQKPNLHGNNLQYSDQASNVGKIAMQLKHQFE